jgi:Fungal protein kinase
MEVSTQESFPQRMFEMINEKSYLLFLTQNNHHFVPALKFDGSGNFSLIVTNHQGQIQMGLRVILIFASGKACALMLLRILAALMYGSLSNVVLDPSMIGNDEGEVITIVINKKEFTVFRQIYALQALVGRGTKVWIVTRENLFYILKYLWVQSGQVESEVDFLQLMSFHPTLIGHISELIKGEDLQIGNHADSTVWYCIDGGQVNWH